MSVTLHLSWSILWFWIHGFRALPTHFIVLGKASLSCLVVGMECSIYFPEIVCQGEGRWESLEGRELKISRLCREGVMTSLPSRMLHKPVNHSVKKEVPTRTHWQRITSGVDSWLSTSFDIISRQGRGLWTSGKSPVCSTYLIQGVLGSQLYRTASGFTWIWAQILTLVGHSLYRLSHLLRSCSTSPLSKVWKCSGKSGKGNDQKLLRKSSTWPWGRLA